MAAEQYRAALPGWMRLSCCKANKPPLPCLNLLALGGISCHELYRLLLRASCTQIHELLLFIDIPCRKSAPSCAPLLERSCKPWVRPGIKLRQRWFLQPGVSSLLGKWLHQGVPPCLPPCQHSPALLHCPQLPALPQTSPKGLPASQPPLLPLSSILYSASSYGLIARSGSYGHEVTYLKLFK